VSAPFLAQFFKDELLLKFQSCDFIFCNESEAVALSEAMGCVRAQRDDSRAHARARLRPRHT
jgi:sugar/nucleoside kinase (ribokinase family)